MSRTQDKVEGVVPFLDRNDPQTWLDPADRPAGWENTKNAPGERSQSADGELSAVSEWRWHHAGHDPDFLAATSSHPNVVHVVESLMGGPVREPNRNRGIYFIFPRCILAFFRSIIACQLWIMEMPLRTQVGAREEGAPDPGPK
jgi:hypothetical protein